MTSTGVVSTSCMSAKDAGSLCGSNAPMGKPAICPIEKYMSGNKNAIDVINRISSALA